MKNILINGRKVIPFACWTWWLTWWVDEATWSGVLHHSWGTVIAFSPCDNAAVTQGGNCGAACRWKSRTPEAKMTHWSSAVTRHHCSLGFETRSHSAATQELLCIISHQARSWETSGGKIKQWCVNWDNFLRWPNSAHSRLIKTLPLLFIFL